MAKKLQLSVPEPCQQEWDGMTPAEGGRFCGSCQKVVVDFSAMTDQQLIAYFQKSTGAVCGRFEKTQLEREMIVPKKGWPLVRYFFQFTIPAFLLSLKASAQKEILIGKRAPVCTVSSTAPVKDTIKTNTEALKIVSGKVVDEKGNPIPFATVAIKTTNEAVAADANGDFILKYKQLVPITLKTTSVGYKTTELKAIDTTKVQVVMPMELSGMLGGVVVTSYRPKKQRKLIPLFNNEKRDTAFSRFSVYPNPVRSNGNITIESRKLEKGEYDVQLISLDGKQMCMKTLILESKGGLLRMDIPTLTPGQYIVTLMNKRNKKAYTEKITVL